METWPNVEKRQKSWPIKQKLKAEIVFWTLLYAITFELNDYPVKLYNWAFKFRKALQKQIWGGEANYLIASFAVHLRT